MESSAGGQSGKIKINISFISTLIIALLIFGKVDDSWPLTDLPINCVMSTCNSNTVKIPRELGKILLAEDHEYTFDDRQWAGDWWKKDPNELYEAEEFNLDDNGGDGYLIRTKSGGPREFSQNNPVWVAGRTRNGFTILLEAIANSEGGPKLINNIKYKRADIWLECTDSAIMRYINIFEFDGSSYIPKECRTVYYKGNVAKSFVTKCSRDNECSRRGGW